MTIYKWTYFLLELSANRKHQDPWFSDSVSVIGTTCIWKVWYFLHVRKFHSRWFHQPHSKHGFILLPIGFIRTSKRYMATFYFSSNKVSNIALLITKVIRIYFRKQKIKLKRTHKTANKPIPADWDLPAASTVACTLRWPAGVFCRCAALTQHWLCTGLSTGSALCSLLSSHSQARSNPLPSSWFL